MREKIKRFVHVVFILGIYVLLTAVVGIACQYALEAVMAGIERARIESWAAFITSLGVSAIAVWYISVLHRKGVTVFARMPIRWHVLLNMICLGMSFAIIMSVLITLAPASLTPAMQYAEIVAADAAESRIGRFFYSVIGAPLNEELVFRGLILGLLSTTFPQWAAVTVSACLFGVMHGQLLWIAYAAVSGIVLAIVYKKYNSVYASIAFHSAFNLMGTVLLPFLPGIRFAVILAVALAAAGLALGLLREKKKEPL